MASLGAAAHGRGWWAEMVLRTLLDAGLAVLRARWYLRAARPLGARVRVWGRPVVDVAGGRLF